MYLEKTKPLIQKDTCTPVFLAELFTRQAKTWKQPKYLATDSWLKKIYMVVYYSATIKNEMLPFVPTWLNLENIILSEVRQRQIWYYLYAEPKK